MEPAESTAVSMEERYSLLKFEGLINKLKTKLEYEQTEWATTVELLRQSTEFVIYAERFDKQSYAQFMQDNCMYDIFTSILYDSHDPQVFSQLLQTTGILVQNFKKEQSKHSLYSHNLIHVLIGYFKVIKRDITAIKEAKIQNLNE